MSEVSSSRAARACFSLIWPPRYTSLNILTCLHYNRYVDFTSDLVYNLLYLWGGRRALQLAEVGGSSLPVVLVANKVGDTFLLFHTVDDGDCVLCVLLNCI